MKKTIWIFSVLLMILSLLILMLIGGSGHSIKLMSTEGLTYVGTITLYLSTSIFLIAYMYKKSMFLKKVATTLLSLTLISILYFFYEIFEIEGYLVLIPIGILLIITVLDIKILLYLLKDNINDTP